MGLISPIKLNIADKLEKNKKFRESFFRGQTQDKIAMNIRELRKKRQKTQVDLAKESKMLQSAVSRIEQADYCGWSLKTLFRVADALEARLRVSFDPVEDVVDWYRKKEAIDTTNISQYMEVQQFNGTYATEISIENGTGTLTDSKLIHISEVTENQKFVPPNTLKQTSVIC